MEKRRRPRKLPKQGREADEISSVQALLEQTADVGNRGLKVFEDLPISKRTEHGLRDANYTELTPIQAKALPLALRGADILAAAPTGSGKTLAFLIPALEALWRKQWTGPSAGLGVLVLSPTRELALQTFAVLQKVGRKHAFSAGLVFGGGTDMESERRKIAEMNLLVATPGRLLQHLDQSVGFNPMDLQLLVLDEADRLLDLGFRSCLSAILEHLKPTAETRQTMLFSATQTKSIAALGALSLRNPEYIAAGKTGSGSEDMPSWSVPENLRQVYMTVEAEEKLDVLWWFIKTHLKDKTIVFFSSCKQVRFVYEVFRRMRPGISILQIHGRMKQPHRLAMYNQFCAHKHAILFATDVAARGLDFPAISWVFHLDCPDSIESYIHRAGRTARYRATGQSLLLLLQMERPFVQRLVDATGSSIRKTAPNRKKMGSIAPKVASIAAESADIKYLGQRAVQTYLRSLSLRGQPDLFGTGRVNAGKLAESMGLPIRPSDDLHKRVTSNTYGYPQETEIKPKEMDEVGSISGVNEQEQLLKVKRRHLSEEHNDDVDDGENLKSSIKKSSKRLKILRSGASKSRPNSHIMLDNDDRGSELSDHEPQEDDPIDTDIVRSRLQSVTSELSRRDLDDRKLEKSRLREKRRIAKANLSASNEMEEPNSGGEEDASGASSTSNHTTHDNPEKLALRILEGH